MRSRAKLDYEGVQQLVDAGRTPEPIALLPELGKLLARRAADRGAVNLPLPEQEIEPDGDGWRLVLRAPLPVEEHNAQISLLTGMAAASLMLRGGVGLLRTMPPPKPEAVAKLRAAAESLGVAWAPGASVGAVVATVDPATPRGAAFLDQAADLLRGAALHGVRRRAARRRPGTAASARRTRMSPPRCDGWPTATRPRPAWPCSSRARCRHGRGRRCPGYPRRWATPTGWPAARPAPRST